MKAIKDFSSKLNPTQRILVAIFAPITLLIISLPIAGNIGGYKVDHAFRLDSTWWFWLFITGLIGYFLLNLFSEKK